MKYLDLKYAKIIGPSLQLWKIGKLSPFLATARCPICGDSKKNKYKKRFYIVEKDTSLLCTCHNCGYAKSLSFFLRDIDPVLFKQYTFEKFKDERTNSTEGFLIKKEQPSESDLFDTSHISELIDSSIKEVDVDYLPRPEDLGLPFIRDLDKEHQAKQYMTNRLLPMSYPFLFTDDFFNFAKRYKDDFTHKADKKQARIVIPFLNAEGRVFAFQARSLNGEEPKYYTVFIDATYAKIFGLAKVNKNKNVYIVEGPLDSLFIPNCIAATSSALKQCAETSINLLLNTKNDYVLVYDNEPRNSEIIKLCERSINEGYKVVIWPESYKYKDINEAVVAGMKPIDIYKMIKENTYDGLAARVKFSFWKKL